MKAIDFIVHPMYGFNPNYFGIFEDNDPTRRLLVIANHDNDIAGYWEFRARDSFRSTPRTRRTARRELPDLG